VSEAAWYRQLIPVIAAAALVPLAGGPNGPPGGVSSAIDQRIEEMLPCSGHGGPASRTLAEKIGIDGSLLGYRLPSAGVSAGMAGAAIDLPAESFVEPVGDAVLVGSDDGRTSQVRLVGGGPGCVRTIATSLGRIIRRATVDPAGEWLVALQLARERRRDLGIFRRKLPGGSWAPLLPPLQADAPDVAARIGAVYSTTFTWSSDGASLAVQSCGAIECVTRVAIGDRRLLFGEHGQGPVVSFADGILVARAACEGSPCPTLRIRLEDGEVLR
jgi:hypothetical protein